MYLDSSDLELLYETGGRLAQHVGLRFQSVSIPPGATINSATIQFHVDEVEPNAAVTVTITGEDVDDAITFTSSNDNLSDRPETSASVDWAIPHWPSVDAEGSDQETPDLSTIIQEIVNRPGWSSGNDLVILMKSYTGSGYRTAEAYDGDSGDAPLLEVTYTPDTTPPSAPSITSVPSSPTGDNTPAISGTATEDGGTVTVYSDLQGALTPTASVSSGVWSIAGTSTLVNGTHTLTAVHTDASGNASSSSSGQSLTVDVQTVGDFRTQSSGDWKEETNWERWNGSSWVTASNHPDDGDEAIVVRSGHTIEMDGDINVDQMVIESGGTVTTANGKLKVQDGTGTDLLVSGHLDMSNKDVETNDSATIVVSPTGSIDVDSGTLLLRDSAVLTLQSGVDLAVDGGLLKVEKTSEMAVSSGATVTVENGTLEMKENAVLNLSGTLVNRDEWKHSSNNALLNVLSGGTYEHGPGANELPDLIPTTWDANSTLVISGATTAVPTNFTDTYGNLTWSSTGQTSAINMGGSPSTINGDLTITSTGSSTLRWGSSDALTPGGDYIQSGGTFIFSNGSGTMTVDNVNVTGGTLRLSTGSSLATLDVNGDFTVNGGTIEEASSTSASITLTGTTQQTVSAASGLSGDLDLYLDNSSGAVLASDLAVPRHITLTTGTLNLAGYDLELGGSLDIDSNISNPAAFIFTGGNAATLAYAPGSLSIPTLTVDKSGGSLAPSTDITVSTTATIRAGTLNFTSGSLTLTHGATLHNGGTVSDDITMQRTFSQGSDGWRMIATPVTGINYSSLNTSFHTQGSPWADFTEGTANLQEADFANQDWTEISGADAEFTASDGYIFYMFNQAAGSTILPATWTVTGAVRSSASRSLDWNTVDTDSYNFVGNRTTSNLDWHAVVAASTNLTPTYVTWDPALTTGGGMTGYKYYNSTTQLGDASRYIAPFTAFLVRPSASGGSIAFPTSEAANLGTADYFGKTDATASHIRLFVEGEGVAERETYLSFSEGAGVGGDPSDVPRAVPLSAEYVTLVSLEGDRQLAFDGRGMGDGVETYDLAVLASRPGIYTLSWPEQLAVPSGWEIRLEDLRDHRVIDLRDATTHTLSIESEETVAADQVGQASLPPRFRVTIVDPSRANMPDAVGPPEEPVVAQNYPNPFRERTSIRLSIPEDSQVQVEVFDLLGRRVAVLQDGVLTAGWHNVEWNSQSHPAGQYFYRVRTEGRVINRSMVLVK